MPPPLHVLWVGPGGPVVDALGRLGVDVTVLEADASAGAGASATWDRRRRLRVTPCDLVHLEGLHAIRAWASGARLAGIPVVWHLTGDVSGPRSLPRLRPAALVVDSRAAAHLLPSMGARLAPVAAAEPAETSFPSFGPLSTVGAVCSARVQLGEHPFVQAFAAAFTAPARTRAIVAPAEGDADDVRRLRSLASALGVGDRLEVVSGPVVPHLARLDAFVHLPTPPALDPRPVVDAMAAGVPVIAARRGAGAEVVEHEVTGLVVDADDPADLTLQLMRLDADRALRTRLATGSLRRAQDFTPTRAAQALLEVYRKVGS